MWPKIVRMGTMKIPPAMPSMPPSALAAIETANSHKLKPPAISAVPDFRSRPAREPGYEADLVAAVIEFLVIDGLKPGGVGSALYQEYRAAGNNAEGSRYCRVRRYGFQTVLRFYQRRIVLLLEQRKDRFRFQIVLEDSLADLPWQISFIKGQWRIVRQSHSLNADHWSSRGDRELTGNGITRQNSLFIEQLGGRVTAESLHIFHES